MLTLRQTRAISTAETPDVVTKKGKEPDPVAKTLFSIKGVPVWHEWLKDFADSMGMSTTGLIDLSLRDLAERRNFRAMPKRFGR